MYQTPNMRPKRPKAKTGGALSIQQDGSQALTDTSLHAATTSSTSSEDLALALKYQPILLFDRKDPLDTPLDIDSFFASGKVQLCHEQALETPCETVLHSSQLVNGATHLRIVLPRARILHHDRTPVSPDSLVGGAPPGPTPTTTSTIYVHPVRPKHDRELLYLDYWWYLPYNPGGTADGASCGAGLAIPGATCFDHPSDWEGVTVVVHRTSSETAPVAVQYAQHNKVVRYRWDYLRGKWDQPSYAEFTSDVDNAHNRPLVFVATGTHASYPTPCPSAIPNASRRITTPATRSLAICQKECIAETTPGSAITHRCALLQRA